MSSSKIFGGIRVRLTFLFIGIFGSTLIVFGLLLYRAFVLSYQSEFDHDLYNYTYEIAQNLNESFFGELTVDIEVLSGGGKIYPFPTNRAYFQLWREDGRLGGKSANLGNLQLPLTQKILQELTTDGESVQSIVVRGKPFRLFSYLVRGNEEDDETGISIKKILQVAVPLSAVEREQSRLIKFFGFSIPLTLLVAAMGGLFLSFRAFRPISEIIEKAKLITAKKLNERVPVPSSRDELYELAVTINQLLDRLQMSFESQDRFVADASHQLRTPLAILQGEIEVLKRSEKREESRVNDFLASALSEVQHLSSMVTNLLLLARLDAEVGVDFTGETRLDEVLLEVVSRFSKLAKERRMVLVPRIEGDNLEIPGESDLVQTVLQNLVENAIKYGVEGSVIELLIKEEQRDDRRFLVVSVTSEGEPISENEREIIFERFFRRAVTANTTAGTGLGLAICSRIMAVFGGIIDIDPKFSSGVRVRTYWPFDRKSVDMKNS